MNHGSPLWQTVFVCFAAVLILFEMIRGWRLGLVRQMVRLLGLALAYLGALFGGRMLLPLLRPMFRLPDLFITILAGAVLGVAIYALVNFVGALLFKRTGQQSVGLVRLVYGVCGGLLGIFFGLFTVWLIVVAIRSLGAIANAQVHAQAAARSAVPSGYRNSSPNDSNLLINSLARLNNSVELGAVGKTVKTVDVVPDQTYETLSKLGTVASSPQTAERFLSFPGARALTENPRLIALRNDPEIMSLIEEQRYLDLLQNPKLIDALNDPTLTSQLKNFQLQKALDYALRPNANQ